MRIVYRITRKDPDRDRGHDSFVWRATHDEASNQMRAHQRELLTEYPEAVHTHVTIERIIFPHHIDDQALANILNGNVDHLTYAACTGPIRPTGERT